MAPRVRVVGFGGVTFLVLVLLISDQVIATAVPAKPTTATNNNNNNDVNNKKKKKTAEEEALAMQNESDNDVMMFEDSAAAPSIFSPPTAAPPTAQGMVFERAAPSVVASTASSAAGAPPAYVPTVAARSRPPMRSTPNIASTTVQRAGEGPEALSVADSLAHEHSFIDRAIKFGQGVGKAAGRGAIASATKESLRSSGLLVAGNFTEFSSRIVAKSAQGAVIGASLRAATTVFPYTKIAFITYLSGAETFQVCMNERNAVACGGKAALEVAKFFSYVLFSSYYRLVFSGYFGAAVLSGVGAFAIDGFYDHLEAMLIEYAK